MIQSNPIATSSPVSMLQHRNQRLAEETDCAICGTRCLAGMWVIPLEDEDKDTVGVICSSSCLDLATADELDEDGPGMFDVTDADGDGDESQAPAETAA